MLIIYLNNTKILTIILKLIVKELVNESNKFSKNKK